MDRRTFVKRAGGGGLGLVALPLVSGPFFHGRPTHEAEVVVYGGGTGGYAAAVQAARLGAEVVVVEPSPWVGGMITAAGVSALDGNKYGAGSGLVHEFREALAAHYGSYEALFSGWISLYCYEPHVGHRILQSWAEPLPNLTVLLETDVVSYERVGPRARRLGVVSAGGEAASLVCDVFLDATEYGDGMALAGVPYRLGREARDEYGEAAAPPTPDLEMQDLTYAATLVRQPGAAPLAVAPQERAYWSHFACSTDALCPDPDPELLNHTVHDWESFITYALLPNDKVLLNWPHHANDFPVNVAFFEDRVYRRRHLAAAKLHTLQFVRYMQTALGHPEWQIAEDEYPTADHLPPIPYIRESRRLVNDHVMTMDDVVPQGDDPRAPVVPDSVAVGDYFLDHHHLKHHLPPGERLFEDFPDNGPFQVPIDVFFPPGDDESVLVGEKSIAVTHIVNGCTRLQPTVMLMGQALGVIAAQAVGRGVAPRSLDVRGVQDALLDAGCQLYIMYDVPVGHALFRPVQELALEGVLGAEAPTTLEPEAPIPTAWAERWAARAGLAEAVGQRDGPLQTASVSAGLRRHLPAAPVVTRGAFLAALHAHLAT